MDLDLVVVGVRRDGNRVMLVGELKGQYPLLRWASGKHNPERGLINSGMTVGGVVHLENQIRPGRDVLGHSLGPVFRRTARRIDQQEVAGGEMRVVHQV